MNIDLIRLLVSLGKINPAIWDAIIPHGPVLSVISKSSPASEVALNPQPIPPREKLELASAWVAKEIARAAIAAEAAGSDGASTIVARAIDDWCGTPHGRLPIPWPGPWPYPWTLDDVDADLDIDSSRVVGALTLASVASRMADGEARAALAKGAEQLLEVGLSE